MASFGVFDSFFIIKTSQEWGRTLCSPWQSKLKLNYVKNPSYRELRSLCQINQVCKEENQRRNLTFNNFATPLWNIRKLANCPRGLQALQSWEEGISQALRNWEWILQPLVKFSQACKNNWGKGISQPLAKFSQALRNLLIIFRYFCTYSFRFLSQDILCNYLFSPCNQLKIFLDI